MHYLLLATLLLLAPVPASAEEICPLQGTWRSSEAKTLADMATRRTVTEKQRARLSNRFFGRLLVEYTCTHQRAYFVEDGPDKAPWAAYRLIEQGPQFVVVEFVAGDEFVKRRVEFEGGCYKVFVDWLGFYEYFCRAGGHEG